MSRFLKSLIPASLRKGLRLWQRTILDGRYRSLARRVGAYSSDDMTGWAYMLEVQPYGIEVVLQGYLMGLFPTIFYDTGYARWHDPDERGILPIRDFHVPSKLRRVLRKENFEYRVDSDFRTVMEKCAGGRGLTHITPEYMNVYMHLHEMGLAHSVSAWKDGEMVGGRFGVSIGGYFSGESSFQKVPNAGKASLIRLAEILAVGGYVLRDTGWPSEFMELFGGRAVPREEFHKLHRRAIALPARFDPHAPAIFSPETSGRNS